MKGKISSEFRRNDVVVATLALRFLPQQHRLSEAQHPIISYIPRLKPGVLNYLAAPRLSLKSTTHAFGTRSLHLYGLILKRLTQFKKFIYICINVIFKLLLSYMSNLLRLISVKVGVALLFVFSGLWAMADESADIETLMRQEDYIQTSAMVVSPGDKFYSAAGHLAIRMNCPVQDVDYIYEFVVNLDDENESETLNFLHGTNKGIYKRRFTSDFLKQASETGRHVTEYPLNLTPMQEVQLWSKLDDAVDGGARKPFLPVNSNCTTEILVMLEEVLGPGSFDAVISDNLLPSKRRKALEDVFSGAEISGFAWNMLTGSELEEKTSSVRMFYPASLGPVLSKITNPALGLPLTEKSERPEGFESSVIKSLILKDLRFVIYLLILALCVCNFMVKCLIVGKWFDGLLCIVIGILGCLLWYMWVASLFNSAMYLNVMMALFTPVTLLLPFVKNRMFRNVYVSYCLIVAVAYLPASIWLPQLRLFGLNFLWVIIALRCFVFLFNQRKKSNENHNLKLNHLNHEKLI